MKKLGNELIGLMEDLSEISTNGKAQIKVNRNLCPPEEFKKLFNYFTRGTVLERVEIEVETFETRMKCVCGTKETINEINHKGYRKCPECGRIADIDDRGYKVVSPNPDKAKLRKSIRF